MALSASLSEAFGVIDRFWHRGAVFRWETGREDQPLVRERRCCGVGTPRAPSVVQERLVRPAISAGQLQKRAAHR